MDLVTDPIFEDDDFDFETRLTPIVPEGSPSFPPCDETSGRYVHVSYRLSDPLGVHPTLTEPFVLPGAGLRLWRIRPDALNRDPRPIRDGGDLIAPGLYTPEEFDVPGPDDQSGVRFAVETVGPSGSVADLSIQLTHAGTTGDSSWVSRDVVRVTGTKLRVWSRELDGAWLPAWHFIYTDTTDQGELLEGMTPGAWLAYQIQIIDPRTALLDSIDVNGNQLPLEDAGSSLFTPEFLVIGATAGPPADFQTFIRLGPGPVDITYNPTITLPSSWDGPDVPVWRKESQAAIEEVIADLKGPPEWDGLTSIDGTTYSVSDDGRFGKEVHRRVAIKLQGNKWLHNYWIEVATMKVVHVGEIQPPGFDSDEIQQVDVVRTTDGYRPAVGDHWDASKVDGVQDIKTTVSGELKDSQRRNLYQISGDRKKVKVLESVHRWTPSRGWHINKAAERRAAWAKALGLATAGMAIIAAAEEAEAFRQNIEPMLRLMDDAPNEFEARAIAIEYQFALGDYFKQFFPESDPIDVVNVFLMYHRLGH